MNDHKNTKKFVLIACEESQTICKAFREAGFNAFSNDIQKCSGGHPEWHIIRNALDVIDSYGLFRLENGDFTPAIPHWDLVIAHPPCTYLAKSSAVAKAQGKQTIQQMIEGRMFFLNMWNCTAIHLCVENPVPLRAAELPPYTQIVNPFDFGHNFSKQTCLWLRNLPPLLPTRATYLNAPSYVNHCSHTSKRRSKTFAGIAEAMVEQWGNLI